MQRVAGRAELGGEHPPQLAVTAGLRLGDGEHRLGAAPIAQQRAHGISLYGQIHPRISDVRVEGKRAVVTDCQDASHSGQADASGQPRTVGLARNPVSGTLHRGTDGEWRMARIDYPGGSC